jgi:hypothetical protein
MLSGTRLSGMSITPRMRQQTGADAPARDALHDRAADNLRFIRDTMARAGAFTSVSGRGMMGVGAVGLAAALGSLSVRREDQPGAWTLLWFGAALIAGGISWVAIRRKALRTGESLIAGPARRFALAFAPAIAAGAVLSVVFLQRGLGSLLAGMWLTIYGAAVTAGGAYSVRPVPVMGAAFLVLGAVSFVAGPRLEPLFLAAGFGGLHLLFGFLIARHHGG